MAVNDSSSFNCNAQKIIDLVTNDYDPDNNTPLSLVSIASLSPGWAWGSVSSSTSVTVGAGAAGTYNYSYIVQDSLGATATGTLTITVGDLNGKITCLEPPG